MFPSELITNISFRLALSCLGLLRNLQTYVFRFKNSILHIKTITIQSNISKKWIPRPLLLRSTYFRSSYWPKTSGALNGQTRVKLERES